MNYIIHEKFNKILEEINILKDYLNNFKLMVKNIQSG